MRRLRYGAVLGAVVVGLGGACLSARADDLPPMPLGATQVQAPDPQASATQGPDEGFLNLPAFDVEKVDVGTAASGHGHENARENVHDADGTKIKVGDSIVLRIQGLDKLEGVKDPETELKLEAPAGTDSLTDQGWDVTTDGATPVPAGEYRVKATPLKAGHFTLPSLEIKNAAGKALARTNPFTIDVESAIRSDDPKPDQPVDLRPPVSLRFPWWVIAVGVLLLLAGIVGGVMAYRKYLARKARPKPAAPAEPPKPEDEVALAALAELERNGPLKRGEFKAHYFKLSEIMKAYIGARYRFDASESTTREMITLIEERRALGDQQIDKLETLFEKLDLVKFTDHVPMPDEGLRLLGAGREFVMTTRRPPEIIGQQGIASQTAQTSGPSSKSGGLTR